MDVAPLRQWATALERELLAGSPPRLLAVDAEALTDIASKQQLVAEGHPQEREASDRFTEVVVADIRRRGWDVPDRAGVLARCVLFSLAYSLVSRPQGQGPPDYFRILRRISETGSSALGATPNLDGERWPEGLNQSIFQRLWWRARELFDLELPAPDPGTYFGGKDPWSGQHCNLKLVQSQALFRRLDLQSLREQLATQQVPTPREIAEHARAGRLRFSPYAYRILADEDRHEALQRQLDAYWLATLEAEKAPTSKQANPGFKAPPSGLHSTGAEAEELAVEYRHGHLRFFLGTRQLDGHNAETYCRRRAGRHDAILGILEPASEAFVVRRKAHVGDEALLLVQRVEAELAPALAEIAGAPVELVKGPGGLPSAWALARFKVRHPAGPDNLWSWICPPALHLQGGLALDRRRRIWLEGAGPEILTEDGAQAVLDGSHEAARRGPSAPAGLHRVWIPGGSPINFEIVKAKSRVETASEVWHWPASGGWPELACGHSEQSLDGVLLSRPRTVRRQLVPASSRGRPRLDQIGEAFAQRSPEGFRSLRRK